MCCPNAYYVLYKTSHGCTGCTGCRKVYEPKYDRIRSTTLSVSLVIFCCLYLKSIILNQKSVSNILLEGRYRFILTLYYIDVLSQAWLVTHACKETGPSL